MIRTYRIAAKAFVGSFPLVIIISVMLALAKQFLPSTSQIGGTVIACALMAFYAHRAILLDETHSWRELFGWRTQKTPAIKMWPFLWRMYICWAFAAGVCFSLFMIQKTLFFAPDEAMDTNVKTGLVVISFALTVVFALPVLAAFGTMLPAAATGGNASLSAAWHRGRQRFWRTLGRLWGGSVLFDVLIYVMIVGLLIWLFPETGNPGVYAALRIPIELAGIFAIYLTAAALSLAYMETEGEEPRAPGQTGTAPDLS